MIIVVNPIGIIHSAYPDPEGTPIQPVFAKGEQCRVEIFPDTAPVLPILRAFRISISSTSCTVLKASRSPASPFDTQERGIFATRAPRRPNPIGFSVVELMGIDDGMLTIGGIDIVDGTPLLDIKPYVPDFDVRLKVKTGWYEQAGNKQQTVADERFVHKEKGNKK